VSRRSCYGIKNLEVPGATAKISREAFADLIESGLRSFFEEMRGRKYHAGSADPALCCAALEEGPLQGMQSAIICQALDRNDGGSSRLQRRNQAAIHQHAIHDDGTRSALAFAATFFGARQVKFFAQDIQEPGHRVGVNGSRHTVHRQGDFPFHSVWQG
jgi:hypothetical protein